MGTDAGKVLDCMVCGESGDNITADDYEMDIDQSWIYCKPCDAWTCFEGPHCPYRPEHGVQGAGE